MAKVWDKLKNSNAEAYVSYFGRGILVVVAVLVIAGLIAFSFYYGNRKHDEASSETTATNEPASNNASSDSGSDDQAASNNGGGASQDQATSDSHQNAPVTGGEMANTGPEDLLAPLAGAAIVLAAVRYRKSQAALRQVR